MNAAKVEAATCTPVPALELRAKPLSCLPPGFNEQERPRADPLWLARECANAFLVETNTLRERDRHKSAAAARHVFWWIARSAWGTSYPDLGRLLRSEVPFDHTTVMSAVRRIEREVDKEARFIAGLAEDGSRTGRVALAIKKRLEGAST